MNKMKRTKMVN